MKNLIEVSHVSKSYGKVQALRDVSFSVKQGELFGLIGPDGAGKSTLFRILTTLLLPDQGSARVLDADVRADFRTIRQSVGYMPGRFSLYQDLTVEENLRFFATVFHTTVEENYERIRAIYEQIAPFKQRRAGALSGGMKQKLALCCALVHAPKVLFLDEPTNDLDIETLMILEEYLEHFNGAVVAVSHDRYFLDKTMGRIFAFLGNGRIKQYEGGYSDCKAAREKEAPVFTEKAVKVKREEPQKEKAPIKKMSYKAQRVYDTIGDEIAAKEEKIAMTDADMAAWATDFTHLQELSAEKEALEAKLEERMERWMELSELAEEIERNKA